MTFLDTIGVRSVAHKLEIFSHMWVVANKMKIRILFHDTWKLCETMYILVSINKDLLEHGHFQLHSFYNCFHGTTKVE